MSEQQRVERYESGLAYWLAELDVSLRRGTPASVSMAQRHVDYFLAALGRVTQ